MPERIRPTTERTPFWRWLVPRYSAAASASARTASGRTFEGPHPKRPSAGRSSAGIRMSVGEAVLTGSPVVDTRWTAYRPTTAAASPVMTT